jgi:hypothetical protein
MPFKKGTPKPLKSGRKKGTPNRITRTAKEAYAFAFDELGGAERLRDWAESTPENLREFYRIHSKLIPIDVTSGDKPIAPSAIRVELIAPSADE